MKTIFTTTRYGLKRIQISTETKSTITPRRSRMTFLSDINKFFFFSLS